MIVDQKGFAARIAASRALIYDLRVFMQNEHRYFIIQVTPAKQHAFLKAVEQDKGFRLEDYGDILCRGWDEPSNRLKHTLHTQYGMYPEMAGQTASSEDA